MRLIKKYDLMFLGDRLVDMEGQVITPARLVHEVNELVETRALLDFIAANSTKIEMSTENVVYRPVKLKEPHFTSHLTAITPLLDEDKAAAAARAVEFLDMQVVKSIDAHLDRYPTLAKFLVNDYIEVADDISTQKFRIDPFSLTSEWAFDIVREYHDPAVTKLLNLVKIDFS
jgi:hypothetical protein